MASRFTWGPSRSIRVDEVDDYLKRIYTDQYARFEGEVSPARVDFASPGEAARHLKEKALEFGADIVGICEIEPSDVYRGRSVTDKYAIAVGQRMRWREFQVVPSRESAIECLRVYFTLGETVIQLAAHIRSLGYACKVEHPIGVIKRVFGFQKVRYRGLAKNLHRLEVTAALANLFMVRRRLLVA